jgi:hypothetical protein
LEVAATDPVIVLSAPLPTITDDNDWGEVADLRKEVVTTQKERTDLTLEFNRRVGEFCKANGMGHLNLDQECLGENGIVKDFYMHPNRNDHHYHKGRYAALLARRLKPMLDADFKGAK